ncbi:MAG TPA: hypothetical protein VFA26_00595 [Gemmataceae bacterium]|nr:hypothetical protein [Gemmataceae bacterium]
MQPSPFAGIHHPTSQPFRFFGREAELSLLDRALGPDGPSVVALVGPGGQGKTAVVQHWLGRRASDPAAARDVFLWSFYRGKDADLCLRALYGHVAGVADPADVSATWCVDGLLKLLPRRRWVVVLDGLEVAQHDAGPWFGRLVHPELGRLVEELASRPLPGVVLLTSRFAVPGLERCRHARVLGLGGLDAASARGLLASLGVRGEEAQLEEAAAACGFHAKAVELLGTWLARFHGGDVRACRRLPDLPPAPDAGDEENRVARVLAAHQAALSREAQDVLGLATAFRDPPTEARLLDYLASPPVRALLHETWGREYQPFADRPAGWLAGQVQELIDLRLLERVGLAPAGVGGGPAVIDAHPLVRRGFEHALGTAGRRQSAAARAGFLRGRPDRRRAATLEEAREEVELFHAYCDAGLWPEADAALAGLDNPRYRFLAPAFERDLLLRFFPGGDWRRPPLWPGFRRHRSLAVCLELLGDFEDALAAYREADAPLRGDALLALGRLGPLLDQPRCPHPWQVLWGAYRAHALCLAGRADEAVALACSLVPVDAYEWAHVFECLLRAGRLDAVDLRSFLYRPPSARGHRWADLARLRMRADYLRLSGSPPADLGEAYRELLDAYDRGGLPQERCLTRLGYARWLLARRERAGAAAVNAVVLELARRHRMPVLEADAWHLAADIAGPDEDASRAAAEAARLRQAVGYRGPTRP